MTQPSIGRHVNSLEQSVNAALFTRSRQGLRPTALGLSLIPQAQAMAAAAQSLQRAASAPNGQARGTVRVTASEMMGTLVLPAMLAAFRAKHPAIVVELALSNRNEDLLQREADIAVRMQRPTQSALVARHVGDVRLGLFAHERYARECGLPQSLAELASHPLIGIDRDEQVLDHPALKHLGLRRESFALRCDSDVAQLMAMKAGFGIGACQIPLAADDPDCVAVLPGSVEMRYEVWLAMHEDQRHTHRIRLLFEHLAEALGAYVQRGEQGNGNASQLAHHARRAR